MSRPKTDFHGREQAVQVVTERSRLQRVIAATQRDMRHTEKRLTAATERGVKAEAAQLQRARQELERTLEELRVAYARSAEEVDRVKVLMREEEKAVRQKNSEALRRCAVGEGSRELATEFGYVGATLLLMAVVAGLFLWLR